MSMSHLKTAIAAALSLGGICAAQSADASITYTYTMNVTSTNISGLGNGSLVFTLSAPPTLAEQTSRLDVHDELTAFLVQLDGFTFSTFNSCGAHPTGCASNLQFQTSSSNSNGALWNLTYTGQSTTRSDVTLAMNNTVFSHFYIQSNGQYADGNLVFVSAVNQPSAVPESSSLSLLFAGIAPIGGLAFLRRRKRAVASI